MNGFLSSDVVERLKKEYPKGTRLVLLSMDDPYSKLVSGDRGTVNYVDSAGTIHMRWDKGSSLGLVYGVDSFRNLTEDEIEQERNEKESDSGEDNKERNKNRANG